MTVGHALLHGQESDVFADAGDQGADKRPEAAGTTAQWQVAMKPSVRRRWRRTPRIGWMIGNGRQSRLLPRRCIARLGVTACDFLRA